MIVNDNIRYDEYLNALVSKATSQGMNIKRYKIKYNDHDNKLSEKHVYTALRLSRLERKNPNLLITAGFHGDEAAGPITLLEKLEDIINLSKQYSVDLIIFPCINPSGFDLRQHHNIVNAALEHPPNNNDFMRYVVNHKIVDELRDKDKFDAWVYSWDKNIVERLPHETIAMHRQLKKLSIRNIHGHLDLHQDCFSDELLENNSITPENNKQAMYAYVFHKTPYKHIMHKAEKIIPAVKNSYIDTAYRQKLKKENTGNKIIENIVDEKHNVYSDENGFVYLRDGSITDLTDRLKVPYVAAVETTVDTPIELSMHVYMTWIEGFMELIDKKRKTSHQSILNA